MYASLNQIFTRTQLGDWIKPKNWEIQGEKLFAIFFGTVEHEIWWPLIITIGDVSLNINLASFYVCEFKFWARVVKFIPSSGCVPDLFPFTAGENSSEEFLSRNITYSTKYYLWGEVKCSNIKYILYSLSCYEIQMLFKSLLSENRVRKIDLKKCWE